MTSLQFISTVSVRRGRDQPVEEIDNVAEAIAFLRAWPAGRRGPVYRCALNACAAAMAAQMSAEEARKSFAGFARITGLLVEGDMPAPALAENSAPPKPVAH